MQIDWSKYLSIDSIELDKYIQLHSVSNDFKLNARFYSVRFKGNLLDVTAFAEHLSDQIHHFVYSAEEIKKMGPAKARGKANKYFGGGDPNTNGEKRL